MGGLPADHGELAGAPPVVTADDAGAVDDPVARDEEADGVGPHGGPHGAGAPGGAGHGEGEGVVGDQGAGRDAEQRLPHLELERRAPEIQRQARARGGIEEGGRDGCDGVRVLREGGEGPAAAHVLEGPVVVAVDGEGEAAEAPGRDQRQRVAEG